MSAALQEIEFTKLDRCDRCGAQAVTYCEKDMLQLWFCQHHTKEFKQSLSADQWSIVS